VIAEEAHDLPTEANDAFRGRPEFKAELAFEHEAEVIVWPAVLLGETTHVQERVRHICHKKPPGLGIEPRGVTRVHLGGIQPPELPSLVKGIYWWALRAQLLPLARPGLMLPIIFIYH